LMSSKSWVRIPPAQSVRGRSSEGERSLVRRDVAGSIPAVPVSRSAALFVVEPEEPEELADVVAVLGRVAHGDVGVDAVVVTSADSLALDIAGFDQVGDDALSCALRDPDLLGDVAEAHIGVALDAQQDLRVVREEPPGLVFLRA